MGSCIGKNCGSGLSCPICYESLETEIVFLPCGKYLCLTCHNKIKKSKVCPYCKGPYVICEKNVSRLLFENLEKSMVNCDICHQKMTVKELKKHKKICGKKNIKCQNMGCNTETINIVEHDNVCEYKIISCCNYKYDCPHKEIRISMALHEKMCKFYPLVCNECDGLFSEKNLNDHLCPEKYSVCDKCLLEYKNKDSQKHMTTECLMQYIHCDKKCGEKVIRLQLTDHYNVCSKIISCKLCGKKYFHEENHFIECPEIYSICKHGFKLICVYQSKRKHILQHEQTHSEEQYTTSHSQIFGCEKIYNGNTDIKLGYEIGTYWDVFDIHGEWHMGRIIDIIYQNDLAQTVLIKYVYWPDTFNEWIEIKSNRLAPFGSITKFTIYLGRLVTAYENEACYVFTVTHISGSKIKLQRNIDNETIFVDFSKCKQLTYNAVFFIGDIFKIKINNKLCTVKICWINENTVLFRKIMSSTDINNQEHNFEMSYKEFCVTDRFL